MDKFRVFPALAALAAIGILTSIWMAFSYAPVESAMGVIQKIFYFHVPSAMSAYIGFFISFIFSILYLLKPNDRNDAFAHAGVEVGVLFTVLVLTTGPLWARPIWGHFFVFDPQLTATLLLFLIYASYIILRLVASNSPRIKKMAAVLAIFGFIDVPIIHVSVRKWGGTHPVVQREGGGGLHPDMKVAFYVCMASFFLLFATIFWLRVRVALKEAKLRHLESEAEEFSFDVEEIRSAGAHK